LLPPASRTLRHPQIRALLPLSDFRGIPLVRWWSLSPASRNDLDVSHAFAVCHRAESFALRLVPAIVLDRLQGFGPTVGPEPPLGVFHPRTARSALALFPPEAFSPSGATRHFRLPTLLRLPGLAPRCRVIRLGPSLGFRSPVGAASSCLQAACPFRILRLCFVNHLFRDPLLAYGPFGLSPRGSIGLSPSSRPSSEFLPEPPPERGWTRSRRRPLSA